MTQHKRVTALVLCSADDERGTLARTALAEREGGPMTWKGLIEVPLNPSHVDFFMPWLIEAAKVI